MTIWPKAFLVVSMLSLAACQTTTTTGEINGLPGSIPDPTNSPGKPYQVTTSSEQAREGLTSQRFELRHGDCGDEDCPRDRQRIELLEESWPNGIKVGEKAWYGWSMYLDNNFPNFGPRTVTILGQGKLPFWRAQLWSINVENNQLKFVYSPRGAYDPTDCYIRSADSIRGKWTDILVFVDYGTEYTGQHMLKVWINGKLSCTSTQPLVTQKMLAVTKKDYFMLRYGVYNSYVSRWLNRNKTKEVDVSAYNDIDVNGGGNTMSITARPFEVDWGVELPSTIVYYDAVKIGETREEVDIRMK